MPVIDPVNTQQVIQMGTHVEKLQQTMQHLPTTTALQLDQERITLDEMKRSEVQDADGSNQTQPIDDEGRKRRGRLRFRRQPAEPEEGAQPPTEGAPKTLPHEGRQIDLVV
ncbi:MAG: hypothetical protein HZA02_01860 [Nitrospinae bacterium]|nr:hypothetical protein [Nitrospinota bacterium]